MFTNFDITPCFLFTVLLASNMVQPSKTQACQPSPCQNGGTCFGNICQCPPRLTGPTCTNVFCDNYPCLNGGTCIRSSVPNQDTCQCPDGFVLPFCTTSCTTCSNRGTCSNDVCSCLDGSVGPTCQNFFFAYLNPVAVTVNEGNNDHDVMIQVCRQPSSSPITFSVYTLSGSASSGSDFENIPFSQDVIIPMGQVCTTETVTIKADRMFEQNEKFSLVLMIPDVVRPFVYTLPGNTQTTITIMNDDPVNCDLDRPCFNGGTCRPSVLQNPCTCPAGFVEPFCTTSCLTGLCQNEGTCSDGVCSCSQGFVGPTCQSAIAVYLSPIEVSVTEGNVGDDISVQIHVCRQQSTMKTTVPVTISQVSAMTGSDYAHINTPVSIPSGQVCASVDISIVSDMIIEPTEVFHVVILPIQLPSSVYTYVVPGQRTATVTIIDNDDDEPPVIFNCPGDRLLTIAPGTSSTGVFWAPPTASDNFGDVTLTSSHQPGDTFSLGQTTVTYTATDGAGNTEQCQFVITVMIDIDECSIGSHICDAMTSECMNTIGSYMCDCKTGYTGESYSPGQQPTCEETELPIIVNCPDDITVTAPAGAAATEVSWTPPFAFDTSGTVTLTSSPNPGDSFSIGSTEVIYTAIDGADNMASDCRFTVTVVDDDECTAVGTNMCDSNLSTCMNTIGSYRCECKSGYTGLPYTPPGEQPTCTDQDECTSSTLCDSISSTCMNTMGSYRCMCKSGYTGSNFTPGQPFTCTASEPPSSPVYLVALVIPVLFIIILLLVIIKRIRRKESKPVDVQDVDYVNAGVTADPGDYIALEEQSRNTPAPKYQDLTNKDAPTQVSGFERTNLETADAAPKAMPRQGIKRQTDYQYEDVNLGETDARKLPSVPQPDLQSEDDTEYEVPEMFEEYTRVYINTLGASKPITPRPMKITEYKNFMGRERSKVISEIVIQYTALKTGQQHPWTAAVKLQNKPKNFFKALLPYDHSRVRLDTDGSDVRSDYINASYIKNHHGKVSFIAAQGPREGTKDDFWRMVWKEDVETIVTLVDKDGTQQHSKDEQYWPNKVNTSQKYGAITVLLMETTAFRSYILTEMNVIKGNEKVLTVRQYEIPCWKYGGVPSEPADLTSVIKQIKNHQKGGKQLLVHCSNGVGATGVFISLYDLMDVIKTKKEVSVFDVIEGMRKDRVNMVLTKLQYLFIFDALLEVILSPDSQMSCDQLKKHDLSAMKEKCKKEFQILQETTKHQEDLATLAGNSSENNHKNRFPDLLPVDKFRPVLKSPGNLFGSNDYINATFAKDISRRGFIMTQSPLASIVEDVWRLVFDYDCKCIVMLNTIDDSDESLTVYWPNVHNAATSNGLMTVICKKIEESDVFTRRQFEVKHKRSQKTLLVDHFSFHGWHGNKPDVHKLREFIKYTRTKGTGPALVHCINGVGLSAVYVTVISELERIEKEGAVDVFQTLNKLRKQCPKAVQTQDEYLLCYELLRDHLNNPEEYAVVF